MKPRSTFQLIRDQQTPAPDGTRYLTCTRCDGLVLVGEVPLGWIKPWEYVCGLCLSPTPYDPATAPIPY